MSLRARISPILFGVTAVVAWLALALQLALLIGRFADDGQSVAAALWRFLGFFTILTNLLVAIVASAVVLTPGHRIASARWRFAALVAILLVGIIYSLALRHIWQPEGWQAVVDHALHDATPLLFLFSWMFATHGDLGWRDALWALVFPFAYLAYALARGAFDGWYAYYFLDPAQQGWAAFIGGVIAILAGFLVTAALIIVVDKRFAR